MGGGRDPLAMFGAPRRPPRPPRFTELELHRVQVVDSRKDADGLARWHRQHGYAARTAKRTIRALGARVDVWVVVVRQKGGAS